MAQAPTTPTPQPTPQPTPPQPTPQPIAPPIAQPDVSRTEDQRSHEAREMAQAREREEAKRIEAEEGLPPGTARPARQQPTTTSTPPPPDDADPRPVYSNPNET